MKDMKNLDLASSMLAVVEKGFRKAHGPGLQRLTALKGDHCAEKLLYVRLHLLQVCTPCFLAVIVLSLDLEVLCIHWALVLGDNFVSWVGFRRSRER